MATLIKSEPHFFCGHCGSKTACVIESRAMRNTPGGQRRRLECSKCNKRSTVYTITEQRYETLLEAERRVAKILYALGETKISYKVSSKEDAEEETKCCSDCVHWGGNECQLGIPDAIDDLYASECNYYKVID